MKLLNEIKQALREDDRARTVLVVMLRALTAVLIIFVVFLSTVLKYAGYW